MSISNELKEMLTAEKEVWSKATLMVKESDNRIKRAIAPIIEKGTRQELEELLSLLDFDTIEKFYIHRKMEVVLLEEKEERVKNLKNAKVKNKLLEIIKDKGECVNQTDPFQCPDCILICYSDTTEEDRYKQAIETFIKKYGKNSPDLVEALLSQ